MGSRAGVAGLVTLLSGGGVWFGGREPVLPVVRINEDDSLLAHWPSEEFHSPADAAPECRFWNMSVQYDAGLCNHFTIGRSASTPSRARDRALACAGAHGVECVLSPEIGLALPAAFLYVSHGEAIGTMRMLLGPKVLPAAASPGPNAAPKQHVRVAPPGGDGLTDTRTFVFNTTVRVEYLDGATRAMVTSELAGEEAYCIQLLRAAFEERCWTQLD